MVNIYMKNDILSLKRQGFSNRKIALKLNISKDTVNKYVNEMTDLMALIENETDKNEILRLQEKLVSAPTRKSVRIRKVFTGKLKERFFKLIKEDEIKNNKLGPNKQRLTASLLHRKLLSEGFKVGKTTIQTEFKNYNNKNKEAFIKQSYDPGQRAEYDFHQIKVLIDGKLRNIYQATISMPYSNYKFVKHYPNQKFESFIDSLISFFEHIKGVPKIIVFDNMRNVVSNFVYGGKKEYNVELIKISNYYGFKIMTTNPRKGNEKGHVENSGKVERGELFTFKYEFYSLKKLKEYVQLELAKLNKEALNKLISEQASLIKLPLVRYELGRPVISKVDHQSLISIDANFYSVPDSYVGKRVYSNVYLEKINIYNDKHELIAHHKKKVGKSEYSLDILHFTPTFLKKPGALLNSLALKQAPKVIQTLFHKYFTTNVKDFLKLIKEKDIYELSELLVRLNNGEKITTIAESKLTIEAVSTRQLNQISNIFNQGELKQ